MSEGEIEKLTARYENQNRRNVMSKIEVEFEFEIGQLVFFKGSQHTRSNRPKMFPIFERHAQECHGGIQKLYKLSFITELVPEVVLTTEEPQYRPACEEERKEAGWRLPTSRTE